MFFLQLNTIFTVDVQVDLDQSINITSAIRRLAFYSFLMGVPGLWRLLEPAREPIELQQLSGKIIAIGKSIYFCFVILYQ